MKNLVLLILFVSAFAVTNAQTTVSVGNGTPTLDGVLSSGEWTGTGLTTSTGVTFNAMADGQNLYIVAKWNDATENIYKNQLKYNGSTWSKSGDEDRIALIVDMSQNGTDGGNCATMCHGDGLMRTNGGTVDLWHWKAVRSNPMGYVDDTYIDSTNRHGDPGAGATSDNTLVNGKPSFMSITDPNSNVDFLVKDDAAFNAFDPYGVMAPHTYAKSVAFDSTIVFNTDAVIAGYLLKVPDGDRASVKSAGKWDNGVWTVEFSKPYAGTAYDFAVVPGGSTTFTYEIFDNEGANHWMNGFDVTILTLDFSGITDVYNQNNNVPSGYSLSQNYPNPFNPSTKIDFSVPKTGFVSIDLFNAIGEKVASFVNKELNAGNYSIDFNAANINSGIYFYKMNSGSFTETRKMILVK